MTPDEIKESRAIYAASPVGDWFFSAGKSPEWIRSAKAFITHARTALPQLLDDYEAALVKIVAMRRELREIADCPHMRKANMECTEHIHMPGGH